MHDFSYVVIIYDLLCMCAGDLFAVGIIFMILHCYWNAFVCMLAG